MQSSPAPVTSVMLAGRVADFDSTTCRSTNSSCTEFGHRQRTARPRYVLVLTYTQKYVAYMYSGGSNGDNRSHAPAVWDCPPLIGHLFEFHPSRQNRPYMWIEYVDLACDCPTSYCHTWLYGCPMHYRFFTFLALGRWLTTRPMLTKLVGGLQQAPLRHPAKFQPDRANGLRGVRYQNVSLFWPWG